MSYQKLLNLYQDELIRITSVLPIQDINLLVEAVVEVYQKHKQAFVIGNGGCTASADNLATDLCLHPFMSDDKSKPSTLRRLRAFSLSNPAMLTALANDLGKECIYSEQLITHANKNDLLIAFSGSGTSANIVKAIEVARDLDMKTCLITRSTKPVVPVDILIRITMPEDYHNGQSLMPGQTGGNNINFMFEDLVSSISHMITGCLKYAVSN